MENKVYSVEEIKTMVSPIAKNYGVKKVFLFGSYARGEATSASDLDLRIDKGKIKGLFTLGSLLNALEEQTGKKTDLLTTGSLTPDFLRAISKEEILIYES